MQIREKEHIAGLVQDCSNSSALAMELPQSCTKPAIYVDILYCCLIQSIHVNSLVHIYSLCTVKCMYSCDSQWMGFMAVIAIVILSCMGLELCRYCARDAMPPNGASP